MEKGERERGKDGIGKRIREILDIPTDVAIVDQEK